MDIKIVRHTPFQAVYLYVDAAKALRKVRALQQASAHFAIVNDRTSMPVTVDELEQVVGRSR